MTCTTPNRLANKILAVLLALALLCSSLPPSRRPITRFTCKPNWCW